MADMPKQKPLEAAFQRKVLAYLAHLPRCFYYKAMAVSIGGIPDVVACINGNPVYLELKRDRAAKLSPLQDYTIKQILAAGGYAARVDPDNWGEVKNVLATFSTGEKRVQDYLQRTAG